MSILNDDNIDPVLHPVRVKLYPDHLRKVDGEYIARVITEKTLSIEDICSSMKARGGFTGDYWNLVRCVRGYFDEAAYQLCDGFAVTNGYFTIHPHIGGAFKSIREAHDHKKHPISFRLGVCTKLNDLAKNIKVIVDGLADTNGSIKSFTDIEEGFLNDLFIPGHPFTICGRKIKLAGEDPCVGLYFVPVDDPSKAVKVTRLAVNSPSKLIGIAPDTGYQFNRIEIRTQYSSSTVRFLKAPRTITSDFTLEAV